MRYSIERADCAVRAVAVATGEDYGRVLMYMAACGRKPRQCTPWLVIRATIRRLGYKIEPWLVDGKTVRTVSRELPDQGGFILDSGRHVAGFLNGKLVDWSEGKLLRVNKVWRVIQQH